MGNASCTVNSNKSPVVPVVLHQGRYRLYEKPDGTLRIQYRRDDKDVDDVIEIPGAMLRMAKMLSEGNLNPLQAIKIMRNEGMSFGGDKL